MESDELLAARAASPDLGRTRRIEDALGRYVVFCKHTFPDELTLDGLTIVVDPAHGAAYRAAPAVLEELGARIITIHDKPNGTNINRDAGALAPQTMAERVVAEGADLGIALDGDADRVVMCDEKGRIVDGDAVMALCGTRMIADGSLAKNTVVATVMSNIGLERVVREAGGRLIRTQVGDRYVVEAMRNEGYNFGGEQSGHLIFLDHMTTGDGIVAALRVLAIMVREQRSLSELAAVMTRTPQVLVNARIAEKLPLESLDAVNALISEVERELGDEGRVLVRYSGTEAKARVMIEGPDESAIRDRAEAIAAELVKACGQPEGSAP
jgi:phosphoglucosamine mutase